MQSWGHREHPRGVSGIMPCDRVLLWETELSDHALLWVHPITQAGLPFGGHFSWTPHWLVMAVRGDYIRDTGTQARSPGHEGLCLAFPILRATKTMQTSNRMAVSWGRGRRHQDRPCLSEPGSASGQRPPLLPSPLGWLDRNPRSGGRGRLRPPPSLVLQMQECGT